MVAQLFRQPPLAGVCVLVVEDDYFIAIELCGALRAAGAEVIGPARDLETALAAVRERHIDCGVLDINLRGRVTFEIANVLRERSVPIIFATGYGPATIPPELSDIVRLEKPIDLDALCRAVASSCL